MEWSVYLVVAGVTLCATFVLVSGGRSALVRGIAVAGLCLGTAGVAAVLESWVVACVAILPAVAAMHAARQRGSVEIGHRTWHYGRSGRLQRGAAAVVTAAFVGILSGIVWSNMAWRTLQVRTPDVEGVSAGFILILVLTFPVLILWRHELRNRRNLRSRASRQDRPSRSSTVSTRTVR